MAESAEEQSEGRGFTDGEREKECAHLIPPNKFDLYLGNGNHLL